MNSKINKIRLTLALLIFVLVSSIGLIAPFNVANTSIANAESSANDILASDSMVDFSPYGLYYSLNLVEMEVKENISERLVAEANANPDKITITNCTYNEVSFMSVPNMSQSNLNATYNETYNRDINGTCTLVALIEIIEALSNVCDEQYVFTQTKDEYFADLIYSSEKFGNTYNSNEVFGTYAHTNGHVFNDFLMPIYNSFYVALNFWADEGHYDRIDKINRYNSITDLPASHVLPMSVLSIRNYDNSSSHSFAIAGAYNVSVSYKYKTLSGWNWLFSKTGSEDFTVLKVCNGWSDSTNGLVGGQYNYQYMVMDYNTPFIITGFNWYDLVSGINY